MTKIERCVDARRSGSRTPNRPHKIVPRRRDMRLRPAWPRSQLNDASKMRMLVHELTTSPSRDPFGAGQKGDAAAVPHAKLDEMGGKLVLLPIGEVRDHELETFE